MRLARRRRLIQKRQDRLTLISQFCRLTATPGMSLDGRRPRRIGEAPPSGVREDPVKLVEVVIILVCLAEACRRGTPPGRPESTEIPSGPRRRGAPAYKKRPPLPSLVDRFQPYLRERLEALPALTYFVVAARDIAVTIERDEVRHRPTRALALSRRQSDRLLGRGSARRGEKSAVSPINVGDNNS